MKIEAFPLDQAHLSGQVPAIRCGSALEAYFRKHGWNDRLDPTPFFLTDWYAWQNPDWHEAFDCPYQHYLTKGRSQGRDPSPFVDIQRYREVMPDVPVEAIYQLILEGHHSPALGVYADYDDLYEAQRRFHEFISPYAHRLNPIASPRQALVVLQAGRGAMTDGWANDPAREWDLMVNYYDAAGFQAGLGDYAVVQKGTKFSSMWCLWRMCPEILMQYEHVLFLDDDVEVSCSGLNQLFQVCREQDLALAQMSLTQASSCNWDELFHVPAGATVREVSAVEIMMPVFSRNALANLSSTFEDSISGFGLDLVWGALTRKAGGRVAVVNSVQATHARPVDQSDGAYYKYLRANGINAKAELWALLSDYGVSRDVSSANCASNSVESAFAS